MIEIQKESCEIIERLFNPIGKYKLNLYEVNNNSIMIRPIFKLLKKIPTPPLITPLLYNSSTKPPKPS